MQRLFSTCGPQDHHHNTLHSGGLSILHATQPPPGPEELPEAERALAAPLGGVKEPWALTESLHHKPSLWGAG